MKKYKITIYYNGAKFNYWHETNMDNFAKDIDGGQLRNEGFTTLEVVDEYDRKSVIHLAPQNCGHVEIREVKEETYYETL